MRRNGAGPHHLCRGEALPRPPRHRRGTPRGAPPWALAILLTRFPTAPATPSRPSGPAGQAPPDPYRARPVAPTSGECPPHRRCADLPLSGRRASSPTGLGTREPAVRSAPAVLGTAQPPVSCGRVHTMRTISPWQSAAHDPAGDGIRNAGGRGTRRLAADWCFTGLRDPRAPPSGASPTRRAIDDSPTFRSAALPSSSCPP
jgi:hypothetical protein